MVAEPLVPGLKAVSPETAHGDDGIVRRALEILSARLARPGATLESPKDLNDFVRLHLAALEYEVFAILFLDAQNRAIAFKHVALGTLSCTHVYVREIAKMALLLNAASIVIVHNHPSGTPEPSRADEMLTSTIKDALRPLEIRLLDHLIVAGEKVTSFVARGLL